MERDYVTYESEIQDQNYLLSGTYTSLLLPLFS